MNVKKILEKYQTSLIVLNAQSYNAFVSKLVKIISGKKVCYITLNKTFPSIDDIFKKKRIDVSNFFYIDAISKVIKKTPKEIERGYYVSSPGALTELSLVITNLISEKFDYFIFDSINNLLTYRDENIVEKFISSIFNKIKDSDIRGVFLIIKTSENSSFIDSCSLFVDNVSKIK